MSNAPQKLLSSADRATPQITSANASPALRMMLALEAGQRAGGDRRGRQSAAMRIHTTEEYADLDLRVDDHEVPLVELRRLWEMSQGRPKIFRSFLATKANPAGVFDRAVIDAAIAEWEAAQAAAAK